MKYEDQAAGGDVGGLARGAFTSCSFWCRGHGGRSDGNQRGRSRASFEGVVHAPVSEARERRLTRHSCTQHVRASD